jgi:hypothetical protein
MVYISNSYGMDTKPITFACSDGTIQTSSSEMNGVSDFHFACRGKGGLSAVTFEGKPQALETYFKTNINEADVFGPTYKLYPGSLGDSSIGSSSISDTSSTDPFWDRNDSVTTLSQEEIKLNESHSNISRLNDEIQSEEIIAQEKQSEAEVAIADYYPGDEYSIFKEEVVAIKEDMVKEEVVAIKEDMVKEEVVAIKEDIFKEEVVAIKEDFIKEEFVAIKEDFIKEEFVAIKEDFIKEEVVAIKEDIIKEEVVAIKEDIIKEEVVATLDQNNVKYNKIEPNKGKPVNYDKKTPPGKVISKLKQSLHKK